MKHVFISYVREDQETVDRLCKELRSRGVKVWLDREDILPGQRWRESIRSAVKDGAFFIACFSDHYSARERSYMNEELTLFLDIGTNAELVVGNKDWLACTACSAGPAFEGGGIEFGMRAAKGAIEDFSIDPVSFEPMIFTIGDVRPKGICGSGLITMTAVLFEMGVINNSGKFNRELNTPRIRKRNDVWEYVLAWKDDTQIDRDIALTEPDIDNLIRAKGAIYSGCMTLLEEVGLSLDMVEHIILAGGFGSYIDLEKAMTIGLLPEIDPDRVTFIGNGSLMGARMSSLTNRIRKDVVEVTKRMTNFELSETPSYMDNYVAAMFLPHTEIEKFPKLKERMEARKKQLESISA